MTKKSRKKGNSLGGAVVYGDVHTAGGDFIGRDQINQFQVYSYLYKTDQAEERFQEFLKVNPQPYFPDRPFSTSEERLFAGRADQCSQIVERLRAQQKRTLVVSGPADVGKTSLLSAGIIPQLCKKGSLVIHLKDYAHPEALIRAALLGQAYQEEIKIAPNSSLSNLAEQIVLSTHQGLILVLDQFERYYLEKTDPLEKELFHEQLSETLRRLDEKYFHILLGIRQDWLILFDTEWGDELPGIRINPYHLQPLKSHEAIQAIKHPLTELRKTPGAGEYVQYNETVVEQRLIPDLDALDDQIDGSILPSDLQIVCNRLYEIAHGRPEAPLITESLYLEASQGRGAEKIIDQHFEGLLMRLPAANRNLARDISTFMLDAAPQFWMNADEIHPEGATSVEIGEVLDGMAAARILIWHYVDGQKAYAFASHSIANAAYRLASLDARRRSQSRDELKHIWRAWNTYDALASTAQLNYLQQYSPPFDEFLPERVVLLLRSALVNRSDPAPWLERMYAPGVQSMLKQVEENRVELVNPEDRLTRYNQLLDLLGCYDLQTGYGKETRVSGAISYTAAQHPDQVTRETTALALMSSYGAAALTLLDKSVQENKQGSWRLAELRAMLADGAQGLGLLEEELQPGKLGRVRLQELAHQLDRLKDWMKNSGIQLFIGTDQNNLQEATKSIELEMDRLGLELDSGRLDNWPAEKRLQIIGDLRQVLTRLIHALQDHGEGQVHTEVSTSVLDGFDQYLEHLNRWMKILPSEVKEVNRRRKSLEEASRTIQETLNKLAVYAKIQIWCWRFIRRFKKDSHYIWQLTLGGALGGGLGLGLLRAISAILLGQNPGYYFYNYFPMGFVCGAGLAFGLLMTNVVRFGPPEHGPGSTQRRKFGLAIFLGTLGFALAHQVLSVVLTPAILARPSIVPLLAIPAGLGLSLATFDQPLGGWKIGAKRWLLRLVIVALLFTAVQVGFVRAELAASAGSAYTLGLGLVFAWSGEFYSHHLPDLLHPIGLGGITTFENWYHLPAILDSALTGIVLAVGITVGLIISSQSYRRKQRRLGKAGF